MQLPPLPLSSHAKPVDVFQAAVQLEKELTQVIKGKLDSIAAAEALYATDGSNYRQIPIGLVVPRDDADVIAGRGGVQEVRRSRSCPRGRYKLGWPMLQCRRCIGFHKVYEPNP